jgi:hypothetical protein
MTFCPEVTLKSSYAKCCINIGQFSHFPWLQWLTGSVFLNTDNWLHNLLYLWVSMSRLRPNISPLLCWIINCSSSMAFGSLFPDTCCTTLMWRSSTHFVHSLQ